MTAETRAHWEGVYSTRSADQVSWHRPHLEVSFELLVRAGLNEQSRVIDIGGGASTLVDDLLDFGVRTVTVVDLSGASLAVARQRLGERATRVNRMAADVTTLDAPQGSFDLWHDRAALHFLVKPEAARAYVRAATQAIAPGGHAVVGCFAADGPERCSGLPVVRRDPPEIAALFGVAFSLVESRREVHRTPSGGAQRFAYALLRKAPQPGR
ncbi:MAG: class I SAM-dependent methyltransferase [Steroidobacter sp.]